MTNATRPTSQPEAPPRSTHQGDERRRQWAKLFALVSLIIAALWGAKQFKRIYPYTIQIEYNDQGVAHTDALERVEVRLLRPGQKKPHAWATYFYHQGRKRQPHRQTLRLPAAQYTLYTTLIYKKHKPRMLKQVLHVRENGRFYVHLKRAR